MLDYCVLAHNNMASKKRKFTVKEVIDIVLTEDKKTYGSVRGPLNLRIYFSMSGKICVISISGKIFLNSEKKIILFSGKKYLRIMKK